MSDFVAVAKRSDIPDPGSRLVELGQRLIVVFHVGGEFYALDDVCTHDGGPLGEGDLDNHAVICPRHGARFDIRSGKALSMPATQPTASHEVRVAGEDILVKLGDE